MSQRLWATTRVKHRFTSLPASYNASTQNRGWRGIITCRYKGAPFACLRQELLAKVVVVVFPGSDGGSIDAVTVGSRLVRRWCRRRLCGARTVRPWAVKWKSRGHRRPRVIRWGRNEDVRSWKCTWNANDTPDYCCGVRIDPKQSGRFLSSSSSLFLFLILFFFLLLLFFSSKTPSNSFN